MKHASEIFPHALAELLAIGDKARKERETRQRDTRKADDRETIRVSRKEKREQLKLQLT